MFCNPETRCRRRHFDLRLKFNVIPTFFVESQVYQSSSYINVVMQLIFGPLLENIDILSSEVKIDLLCKCISIFLKSWMDHILTEQIIFR